MSGIRTLWKDVKERYDVGEAVRTLWKDGKERYDVGEAVVSQRARVCVYFSWPQH